MNNGELFLNILKENNAVDILRSMDQSGALCELLPELCALKHHGKVNNIDPKFDHKDNFVHTLKVLQNVIDIDGNIELRLTAIFHDLGKATTKRIDSNKGFTFHNHENVSGDILRKVFTRLNLSTDNKLFNNVFLLVTLHGRPKALTEEGVSDSAIRRILVDCGSPEIANLLFDFVTCDTTTSNKFKRIKYKEDMISLKNNLVRILKEEEEAKWRPPINGDRIMELTGLKPGRELANIISLMKEKLKNKELEETVEACELFIFNTIKNK